MKILFRFPLIQSTVYPLELRKTIHQPRDELK